MITNMNKKNQIQFLFKTKKNPQTSGDLALAKLPLQDSKVKSLKKEREKEMKCQCLCKVLLIKEDKISPSTIRESKWL